MGIKLGLALRLLGELVTETKWTLKNWKGEWGKMHLVEIHNLYSS